MKKSILVVLMLIHSLLGYTEKTTCLQKIVGYKIVPNSIFPFKIENKEACFFAFYIENPDPVVDMRGNGNIRDSVWYGYYKANNSQKIYEFPKPADSDWANVCSIDAVSFFDMNGDNKPDVTVIGACDEDTINYTYPFVFMREGNRYILNEDVYKTLFGFLSLSVADVREYIKSPKSYLEILKRKKRL